MVLVVCYSVMYMSGKKKTGDVSQAGGSASAASGSQIVVSKGNSVWDKLPLGGNKGVTWLVVAVVVLVLGGAAYWYVTGGEEPVGEEDVSSYKMSDKDYAKSYTTALEKRAPAATASAEEQRTYYDELMTTQYAAENYQGVVDSYEAFSQKTNGADMNYSSYVSAARSYMQLGQNDKALLVITAGEEAVKKSTTDESLLSGFLGTFSDLRKEASS